MAAPVPPGAPMPGYNSQEVPPALGPPNNNFDFQNNPDSLADNMNNLNLNRPPSMPNSGPRPPPFGQPPPFSRWTSPSPGLPVGSQPVSWPGPPPDAVTRPVGPSPSTLSQNMPPLRPTGPPVSQPPAFGSRPPPPGSLPSSMVSPSIRPSGSAPAIGLQSMGFSSGLVSEPLPPSGARSSHTLSSLPLSSGSVVPPFSASGGPVTLSNTAFSGPRFAPASSATQPAVGSPTIMASVRAPPQAPIMRSIRGSPASNVPADAPMQPPSPFSAAPRGMPPPPGSLYGLNTGPMHPQQMTPPYSVPGSAQSPGMFGMPLSQPSQSMTTISPAVGQPGTHWPVQSKVDPRQIPRPEPSSSVIIYETRQGNHANPPPPATTDFITIDKGNCCPRYMRCTIGQVPCTADLLATSGMQLALLVQPLALSHPSEEPVQIVDFGESGPVRCSRCKGYINPFMKFIDQGRRFICNLCGFTDETPRDYHCNLGPDGRRRDADERPELSRGTVEFVASKEYMVRDPMPAVYFFLIDVSENAIQTGATAAACSAISQVISDLPEGPRTMVGVATFDSTIHFYNLKRALQQPLMLIVPDVQDVYTPLQTDIIVQLSECHQQLGLLLENIPTMFEYNKTAESAFGAAIKAAFLAMKSTGGKILVFQSVLPSTGIGTLSSREAEGRTNVSAGEKETHKLLQPADKTLKTMAIELAEHQVCVNVFISTQTYVDIASISVMPRTTGGQVYYYYPFSALSDPAKLYNDLRWNITRPQGFEAVMRVRCSQGIKVQEYSGNFCKTVPTDVDLPGIDCDKSIMVTLTHDDKLQDGSECAFQCALLYTTAYGQRRIRVTNLSLSCTNMLSNLFRSADLDTQFACFLKQTANEIPSTPLLHVREQVIKFCVNILVSYRKFCATVSSTGQLILPESLKLLPLYTLALLKNTGLQTDGRIDDRSFWVNQTSSRSIPLTILLVFPRMVPIHDLTSKDRSGSHVPSKFPLSSENVSDEGIYLLENGEDCLIYVGSSVDSDILQQLFGISSVDEIPTQFMLQQYDNPLSKKFNDLVNEIRRQRCSYLRMNLCKKGDTSGMLFFSYMIEDKHPSGPSYVEFLAQIHREIQMKLTS